MTVTDDKNAKATDSQPVTVSEKVPPKVPPVAKLTATPISGKAPLTVNLDGSESYDPDGGNIVKYAWASSDGQISVGKNVSLIFETAGDYNIQLEVTDDEGDTAKTKKSIIVSDNQPPIAEFMAKPLEGEAPLTVNLDASKSYDPDGTISNYAWLTSDGKTASGKTASLTFNQEGEYKITLTVTDNGGKTGTKTVNVKVGAAPPLTYNLKVETRGNGMITSLKDGIHCGTENDACEKTYPKNASVTLTATPDEGWSFVGWNGIEGCSTGLRCAITMTQDYRNVIANFEIKDDDDVILEIVFEGAGNGVVSGQGFKCSRNCIQSFPKNTSFFITVEPVPGSRFAGWNGVCQGKAGQTCGITMTENQQVPVTFGLCTYNMAPISSDYEAKGGNGEVKITAPTGSMPLT